MLSPTQRVVIASLRHDSPVSTREIIDTVYGGRPDGGPESADLVIRVMMRKARVKLASVGIEIETVGRGRGSVGYRVRPEHREALDQLLGSVT